MIFLLLLYFSNKFLIINNNINISIYLKESDAVNTITSKDLNKFIYSVKYHIICTVIITILEFIENSLFKHLTQDTNSEHIMLKNFLFKKDMIFFDLFKTGELIQKVQIYNQYPLFNFIETCLTIGEYLFKIIYYSYNLYKDFYEMSKVYIISTILQGVFEPYVCGDHNFEEDCENLALRDNYINDILSNIRLVKSFGTEKKELNRIEKIQEKLKRKTFFWKFIRDIYNFVFKLNEVLVFYICGKKTITGKMNYGELLIFQEYSRGLNNVFSEFRDVFNTIKTGINSWKQFLQIYNVEQKIVSAKNIKPIIEENMKNNNKKETKGISIKFNKVSFSYPTKKDVKIIDNFDLNIEPGKTIAIVGNSGSGKTTLSNLLLRFYDVNEGQILVNGINIKDIDLAWLRANIGIVSQEPILTSGTIKENILYGVDNFTEKKFNEICQLANVSSFATDKSIFPKEYETIVGERGIKVSGGQKQRIAIARALMKNAKLYIFDEATSALDSENEAVVQEAINNIIQQKKITSIIIAHRLSTVKNADVIYVMNYGKIVEYGTHDELILKNGEYKKLVQKQLVK